MINSSVTATPAVSGDLIAWATCGTYTTDGLSTATATSATYTLAQSDSGTKLCAYELTPAPLTETGPVVGVSAPVGPVGTGPSLNQDGTPVTQGQTVISVIQGAWGAVSSGPTDAWYRCDANGANCGQIVNAGVPVTGPNYTPRRSDVGSTIEAWETATAAPGTTTAQDGTTTATETTAPTGVVKATAPTETSAPTVSGTAQVGDRLTASAGGWSNDPTDYTYQWNRCVAGACTQIPGATSSSYVPVAADVGDVLVVSVIAEIDPGTNYGAAAASPALSYPTSPVVGIASSTTTTSTTTTTTTTTTTPTPTPPSGVVPVPSPSPRSPRAAIGRLTATMQWTFRYTPTYTQILALAVEGPALGSTITTRCSGPGCPLRAHRITVLRRARCGRTRRVCPAPRSVNLEREFGHHRLGVGARVTIRIRRARDIGKYYRFVIRARRPPSVRISCLAPGALMPGKGCTGV